MELKLELERLWLGRAFAQMLAEAGYRTFEELDRATDQELLAIKGIGFRTLVVMRERVERELRGVGSG